MAHIYTEDESKARDKTIWHPHHIKQVLEHLHRNDYVTAHIYLDDAGIEIQFSNREDHPISVQSAEYVALREMAERLVSCMTDSAIENVHGSIELNCEFDHYAHSSDVFKTNLAATSLLKLVDSNTDLGFSVKRFDVTQIVADIEAESATQTPKGKPHTAKCS
jgi:hypothetical protein